MDSGSASERDLPARPAKEAICAVLNVKAHVDATLSIGRLNRRRKQRLEYQLHICVTKMMSTPAIRGRISVGQI